MNEGMSITAACQMVGIPRSTFYAIYNREPESIETLQKELIQTTQDQIGIILGKRVQLLERLLDEAMAEGTKTSDRLAIYRTVENSLRDLVQEARLDHPKITVLPGELTGPKTYRVLSTYERQALAAQNPVSCTNLDNPA